MNRHLLSGANITLASTLDFGQGLKSVDKNSMSMQGIEHKPLVMVQRAQQQTMKLNQNWYRCKGHSCYIRDQKSHMCHKLCEIARIC